MKNQSTLQMKNNRALMATPLAALLAALSLAACSADVPAVSESQRVESGSHEAALTSAAWPECLNLPILFAVPNQPTQGTAQAECIIGTSGKDTIFGGGGDDRIFSLGGADTIKGGPGADIVFGGDGHDYIYGGDGDDLLVGGNGKDEIAGQAGDDILRGGNGKDTLFGQKGNDALFGDRGQDVLKGGQGEDYLDGREGKDELTGGADSDELIGGPGKDDLSGAGGDDLCNEKSEPTTRCERTSYETGSVIVADRVGQSLSIIDIASDVVVSTVPMPNNGEPMYLAYSPQNRYVFVADRANSAAVVFDAETLTFIKSIPLDAGVFHCWIDRTEGQLWVTNNIDNTASVIDTRKLEVIATILMPADLVADGYRPHDVTLGRIEDEVYITLIGGPNGGVVLRYSSLSFQETARRFLGGDPHVTLRRYQPDTLYVNSQDADSVYVIDRDTLLDTQAPLAVDNAHGSAMNTEYETEFVYTTNIAAGGIGGLVTIDAATQSVTATTNTPFAVPHNVTLDPSGSKLYVTHSGGAADKVSIFTVNSQTGVPSLSTSVTVGLNPFGLTTVPFLF